ncbi:hypothetical protein PoB_006782900 [Plakobranchus ocellatus]|uniref:Uncharacterized protein n=1 Tax=Plakobranchus ocellatus TaxID=259542 RepID=A0AAV4DB01_9GAST|nr:hypothetical protein PoB_006782900 [Plakobranchus ocellatus]
MHQAHLTGRHVNSSLEPVLSYPLLAASEQPATTHCFSAAFGENTSGKAEQCTSHTFWCEHFEPNARNCSKRLAQLTRSY